jgi:hypothetical protein
MMLALPFFLGARFRIARMEGAPVSGELSHRRPKTIVDQVPPESIRAAARDIACRAFDVDVLAVGTCAIN